MFMQENYPGLKNIKGDNSREIIICVGLRGILCNLTNGSSSLYICQECVGKTEEFLTMQGEDALSLFHSQVIPYRQRRPRREFDSETMGDKHPTQTDFLSRLVLVLGNTTSTSSFVMTRSDY